MADLDFDCAKDVLEKFNVSSCTLKIHFLAPKRLAASDFASSKASLGKFSVSYSMLKILCLTEKHRIDVVVSGAV